MLIVLEKKENKIFCRKKCNNEFSIAQSHTVSQNEKDTETQQIKREPDGNKSEIDKKRMIHKQVNLRHYTCVCFLASFYRIY